MTDETTRAPALRTPSPAPVAVGGDVVEAAQAVIDTAFDYYTARNGKRMSIEGDDGEKCWIVPFDQFENLRAALQAQPTASTAQAQGDVVERVAFAIDPEAFSAETIAECDYPLAQKRLTERQGKARDKARAALAAMQQQAPVAEEPWGYGWYEMGGKKCARGYLPTIDYPRSEDVSEGPFPLYRRPQPQADAVVANFHLIDKANHVLMIKSHVEAEREWCAQVAEWHGENVSNEPVGKACSLNIARAIRSGGAS